MGENYPSSLPGRVTRTLTVSPECAAGRTGRPGATLLTPTASSVVSKLPPYQDSTTGKLWLYENTKLMIACF